MERPRLRSVDQSHSDRRIDWCATVTPQKDAQVPRCRSVSRPPAWQHIPLSHRRHTRLVRTLGGNFYVLSAVKGHRLWGQKSTGAIGGGVITYTANGAHKTRKGAESVLECVLHNLSLRAVGLSCLVSFDGPLVLKPQSRGSREVLGQQPISRLGGPILRGRHQNNPPKTFHVTYSNNWARRRPRALPR